MAPIDDASRVNIFDTTLRDGEQTVGVSFDSAQKVEIAQQLKLLGVDIIEAGYPGSGAADFEAVRAVAVSVDGPVICALARAGMPSDIEKAYEAIEPAASKGGARIHTYIGASPIHMASRLKMTEEEVLAATRSSVSQAVGLTPDVEFSPEDATRSDPSFMLRMVLEAVECGATTINIPDTVGFAQPAEYAERTALVKSEVDRIFGSGHVVISAHCHDDLGSATQNTLTAVREGGCRQVEATINGIGERAGNAALEEIAVNIGRRPDYYAPLWTGINMAEITKTSRLVSRLSGEPIPANKAMVGRNVFSHGSGQHQAGMAANPDTYEWIGAATVGQKGGKMVIGKLSGKSGVSNRLDAVAIGTESGVLNRVSKIAKSTAAMAKRRLADTDVESIAAGEVGENLTNRFELGEVDIRSHSGHGIATISIRDTKLGADAPFACVIATVEGGGIEAAVQAINEITRFKGSFETWSTGTASGSEAQGAIFVEVSYEGEEFDGFATDKSVDVATAKAYLNVVNLVDRVIERRAQQEPNQV